MTQPNHTPSPWTYGRSKESFGFKIKDRFGKAIAAISGTVKRSDEECEANARLIAAAPELLEALKRNLWHKETCGGACVKRGQPECVNCLSHRAIAKAEGR